jgi:hypothetical protein
MHATRPNDKTIVDFPTMAQEVSKELAMQIWLAIDAAVFACLGWHLLPE